MFFSGALFGHHQLSPHSDLKKDKDGLPILAAMGKSFQEYYSRATAEEAKHCSDLLKCALAISALAQQTAVTPDQFDAFEALDQGKLSFASDLQPCLNDLFWEERKAFVWDVAAHESTTHAILQNIVKVAGQADPLGADEDQDLGEVWELSQKR